MIIQLFRDSVFPGASQRHSARILSILMVIGVSSLSQSACKRADSEALSGSDKDKDGWPSGMDCNDEDDTVFPGADEIPGDGIDQDCSGSDQLDGGGGEGGQGFGPDECEGLRCGSGGTQASGGTPGVSGKDNLGSGGSSRGVDADGDGFAAEPEGDDCDDDRLEIHPGALEIPLNGVDENCDGSDLVGGYEVVYLSEEDAVPLEPPVIARIEVDGEERFLVAWSDSRKAPGQDIYGQMVDAEGNPVGDELGIEVFDNFEKTDLCLSTTGTEFLIAWVNAEGLWTRQLDEVGHQVIDMPIGFGPPGSIQPHVARSGDHWGIAWKDGVELTGWFRTMRDDRARWDVWPMGTDAVGRIAVAGAPDGGFTVGWTDMVDETSNGIWAQTRVSRGGPENTATVVLEGDYNDLQLAYDGRSTWFAFGVARQLSYAGLVEVETATLMPVSQEIVQLSTEVVSLNGLRLDVLEGDGPYVAWNDLRHATSVPAATAIYSNGAAIDGKMDLQALWHTARPVVVDAAVELGGVSRSNAGALVTGLFDGKVFVLPVKF